MIVFHGTGDYCLEGLLTSEPIRRKRVYVRRACFCTTTDFQIAELFAIRRTSIEAFLAGRISGVVLEYDLSGIAGRDYDSARDVRALQEEKEVAVYNTKKLCVVAVWQYDGDWRRLTIEEYRSLSS